MDIKGRTKGKQIKIIGILLGICVAVVSLFYFFHTEKAEAEERMVEIVNYVKVQCSTYTHSEGGNGDQLRSCEKREYPEGEDSDKE